MKKKNECESQGPICNALLIQTYSVNGSAKEGKTFKICGACAVYIKRGGGAKLKSIRSTKS